MNCITRNNPSLSQSWHPSSFMRQVGLPTCHETEGVGSLIPLPPFGGGRDATQSASRGGCFVQYRTDYCVANRLVWFDAELPSKFLRQHAHLSSNIRGKERRNGNSHPSRATYSSSLFRDIFHWQEVNPIDDMFLLYRAAKPVFGSNFHRRFSFSCLHENGLL